MAPGSTTAEALGLTLVDDTKAPAKKKTNGAVEATNGKDTNVSGKTTSKKATEVESSTDGATNTKRDLAPMGSLSTTKNIYRSPKDEDGNCTWVEKYPEDAVEAAENAETAQYAVVVRNIKSPDSRKKLEAHSILVQSPWLKKALGHILEGYTGVACELERLEFEAPFRPFVHRWTEFRTYMKQDGLDEETRQHLRVLHDILQYEIGDRIKAFEDYVAKGVITFEHLWMIFQPGAVVVSAHKGPLSAFELEETEYKENECLGHFLRIRADCVDYSGKKFGRVQEKINVVEFLGTKKIASLDAYPLAFHPDRDQLRAALVRRGQGFESLAGHHYKHYSGTAITWDREGNEVPIQVDGRIVVDINSFNRFSRYRSRHVTDWTAKDVETRLRNYPRVPSWVIAHTAHR